MRIMQFQQTTKKLVPCLFIICLCWFFLLIHYDNNRRLEAISRVLSHSLTASNFSWRSSLPLALLPADDRSRLVNITGFKFLVSPACSESALIVCVHSAPGNLILRQEIRKSWGAYYPVYFFLGNSSPAEQTKLDREARDFQDLVQGNFNDSYQNLTLKHTMVFKWVVYHCPHVKYVLKCDDDVFINVAKLNTFMEYLSPFGTLKLLMCTTVRYNEFSLRSFRSKWRVSIKDFPGFYYPPFCYGNAVLYSPDIMFKLYELLQKKQNYFWLDDVFVTGMVFAELNISHADFDWWVGYKKSLVYIPEEAYLVRFDPNKNLFVSANEEDYRKEVFQYLTNLTLNTKIKL